MLASRIDVLRRINPNGVAAECIVDAWVCLAESIAVAPVDETEAPGTSC